MLRSDALSRERKIKKNNCQKKRTMGLISNLVGIVVLVVAIHFLNKWNVTVSCDSTSKLEGCKDTRVKETYLRIGKMIALCIACLLLVLQLFSLLGISLLPMLGSILVMGVALGFVLQNYIQDLFSGIFYVVSGTLAYGSVVRLSVPDCGGCKVNQVAVKVDDLSLIHLQGVTSEGERLTIRYHSIAAVEVIS